jgi:hypothetical protein
MLKNSILQNTKFSNILQNTVKNMLTRDTPRFFSAYRNIARWKRLKKILSMTAWDFLPLDNSTVPEEFHWKTLKWTGAW